MSASYMPYFIAVTGYVDNKVQQEVKEAGFDALFMAPISVEDITDKVLPKLIERK
jgi:methylmalonyl-CoA mutase cobalamin-binding subunit